MDYIDKIFIFYNKQTLEIIFIQEPLKTNLTPERFLDERYLVEKKCIGLSNMFLKNGLFLILLIMFKTLREFLQLNK